MCTHCSRCCDRHTRLLSKWHHSMSSCYHSPVTAPSGMHSLHFEPRESSTFLVTVTQPFLICVICVPLPASRLAGNTLLPPVSACSILRNTRCAPPYRQPAARALVQLLVPVSRAVGVVSLNGILTGKVEVAGEDTDICMPLASLALCYVAAARPVRSTSVRPYKETET